jgi:hypothetical protein
VTAWDIEDRLVELLELLLRTHPYPIRVLLGEMEPPSVLDLVASDGRPGADLGVRVDGGEKIPEAERLVERAAPFDQALEAVGGWDGIVRSVKELKEFEPELWEQFAACVRWVRPKRGRYSGARIGDGGHILKLAERLGLGSATVLRRRDAAIREIARGAA